VSGAVAVIFANEAFYAAFARRDIAAMSDVWSQRDDVTCIHPGWPPLTGREAVMKSWRGILRNPASPEIACHHPVAHVFGDVGYVICFERIEATFLIATNIFVREGQGWMLVHHQAGTTPPPALEEAVPSPSSLQ
jgi:ketosteroid isomerase-like protein